MISEIDEGSNVELEKKRKVRNYDVELSAEQSRLEQ